MKIGSWLETASLLYLGSLSCPPALIGALRSGPPKKMDSPEYVSFSDSGTAGFATGCDGSLMGRLSWLLAGALAFGATAGKDGCFRASEADTGMETYLPAS